ncbi:hypothetical protein B0H66DRAFT_566693 [Apodospora peruviana]|uniref:DUF676 domain-containing protein n=1 Tax=Apodospora peruviana TaxID=516989 RepID=A0AAE0LZH3_9PEZI|nr:hypothetical protein B0H66DRAFT_566693 [Apodospora peruviana]
MKRILLLCFLHGFKGNDDTFGSFPKHLEDTISNNLHDHVVKSVVYPKYETKGELGQSTAAFLEWLKERVMELRKEHLDNPWPPNDRNVGVVLVAHSMGGFVASDCLFRILDERRQQQQQSDDNEKSGGPIFPMIQGILAFDTPYNGLARSMFVYGAFSNYQKVSNVFNVMTAISAAAPAGLSRLASKKAASAATSKIVPRSSNPAWKTWQMVAVRTGTVGAIAAGGVAAYMSRKQILEGVRNMRALKKEDVVQGYQQSVDALGQGLAYINRGNVGESFAWLSDHFTFVGALLKQNELNRRLERLAAVKGVGIRDFYASLGENGYWSGGYFVPERTFCAIPVEKDQPEAAKLFTRHVIEDVSDEIVAHMNLFKPDKNKEYEHMTGKAAQLVIGWFNDETDVWDDPKFAEALPQPLESAETEMIAKAVDAEDNNEENKAETAAEAASKVVAGEGDAGEKGPTTGEGSDDGIPDESPIDIAAAASLVPLPDDIEDDGKGSEQKQAYMRHLFGVAQQTGTNLRSYLPTKLPTVPDMPKVSMPTVSMPSMPSIPSMTGGISLFSKKSNVSDEGQSADGTAQQPEKKDGDGEPKEAAAVPLPADVKEEDSKSALPSVGADAGADEPIAK